MKTIAILFSLVFATAAFAEGNHNGFASDSGQGNLSNENVQNNNGTTSVSGPKGQVDKGNTDCNNCSTDLPGNNR